MEEIYLNSQIKWYTLFVDLIFFVANFNSNSNSNSKNFNFNSNSNSNSKKFNSNSIPIQLFFQTSNSNSNSNSGIGIGIAHQFQFRNWIDPMSDIDEVSMCIKNMELCQISFWVVPGSSLYKVWTSWYSWLGLGLSYGSSHWSMCLKESELLEWLGAIFLLLQLYFIKKECNWVFPFTPFNILIGKATVDFYAGQPQYVYPEFKAATLPLRSQDAGEGRSAGQGHSSGYKRHSYSGL